MSRNEILSREARYALPAALSAIIAPALIIGSLIGAGQLDLPTSGVATETIRAFEANQGALAAFSVLRAIGFLLLVPPLLYLWQATKARRPELPGAMIGFVFIGPVLLAAQGILGYLGQAGVASDFIDQYAAGGDIYTLLDDLTEDSSLTAASGGLGFTAILGIGVAMVYYPLQAMRAGLLTRFFATLGMALGGATVLLLGQILIPDTLWFLWLGMLFIGKTPRGRPPAWAAGEAIPWPRPGEEPQAEPASDEVVEGDAAEVFEPASEDGAEERDHSARRERARKRKRKRRR
jgi:hypothetical protein